jgi:hypothetical protein
MADLKSIFSALLRGANPDHSDDEIQAKASELSQHPNAADVAKPFMSNPSDYDVHVSDNTVTQNGRPESIPFQSPPAFPPAKEPVSQTPPPAPPMSPPPTATSPAAKPVATPVATPPTPPVPSLETSAPNDNEARNAMLAQATEARKRAVVPQVIGGVGDAIGQGLAAFNMKVPTDTQDKLVEQAKKNFEESKGLFEEKLHNDPASDVSKSYRDMVLQIAPGLSKDPNFQNMSAKDIGDKLPLIDTMMKAKASEDSRKAQMAMSQSYKDMNIGLRQDQQQDKLEQGAKQMVANLRGDKSLARAEEQRDAAAVAVNRLKEIQASGKGMNPVDYTDILGQIYKARTGAAPGEEVLHNIRQATAKGKLDQAYTFVTGQQAPATTQDITNSLMNMAQSMGKQADAFHQGYMNSHLIKPSGLEDERWQPIIKTGRGLSFAEATHQNEQPVNKVGENDRLGLR